MSRNNTLFLSLLLLALSACLPQQDFPEPTSLPAATWTVTESAPTSSATPLPSPTITPTPEPLLPEYTIASFPYTRYFLSVDLQYLQHQAQVQETISFSNYSGMVLTELPLVVPAQRITDVFRLISLQDQDGNPITNYQLRQGQLTITLDQPLQPNQTITLTLEFTLDLPMLHGTLGYSEFQILMDNWYAFLPPYSQEKGWMINEPSTYGEYLAFPLSSFEVYISVDDPDIVIAAPGMAAEMENGHYYVMPSGRRFTFAASPHFEIQQLGDGNFEVEFYGFAQDMQYADQVLDTSLKALNHFQALFGPPMTNRMVIVESQIPDGMESDGLFFLGIEYFYYDIDPPKDWLTIITAHETSHLWWHSKMGNDPAEHPWLDEALAAYCELLFLEEYYPDAVNWWWNFRYANYDNPGDLGSNVYQFSGRWEYIYTVYLQGVLFWQEIREQTTDEVFFAFLHSLADTDPVSLLSPGQVYESMLLNENWMEIWQAYFPEDL